VAKTDKLPTACLSGGDPASGAARPVNIGGQAVIDGVMMRAPGCVATAVRTAPDRIIVLRREFHSLTRRFPILGWPILRGAVSLIESLIIGTRTLNWSAEVAQAGEHVDEERGWEHRLVMVISLLLAFGLGILLFMYLPYLASTLFGLADKNQVGFHLLVGVFRVSLLIAYLWAISRWRDVQVLFAYHGAEHKSIYAWEERQEVGVALARDHSRFHPRCGTSFLLLVALATVLVYAVFDTWWIASFGDFHGVLHRLIVHLPIIPVVAGVAFELLQLSSRVRGGAVARLLIAPGLWFQRLTTREPDEEQLEVAVAAIRASLHLPVDDLPSRIEFV
jgi:uncharacterized protein YqhQ